MNVFSTKIQFDKIFALACAILSFILTIYLIILERQLIFIIATAISFLTCIFYIAIRKNVSSAQLSKHESKMKLRLSLNIVFFILFILLTLTFYFRPDFYVRPLGYFVLVALMIFILVFETLVYEHRNTSVFFLIVKVIMVALSLRWAPLLMYPGVVGIDPWAHQAWSNFILDTGHVNPDALSYFDMPIYHIYTAITSLITGLQYKYAVMFSIISLQVIIDCICIFLIGKALVNTKIGLISAILLSVANYHIQRAYWTIPTTLSLTIVILLVYLTIIMVNHYDWKPKLIWILLSGTLILTHSLGALTFIILLVAYFFFAFIYSVIKKDQSKSPVSLFMVFSFIIATFSYWMYITGDIKVVISVVRNMLSRGEMYGEFASYEPLISEQVTTISKISSYMGLALFFSLCFAGLFYLVSQKGNKLSFLFTAGCTSLFALAAYSFMGEAYSGIETRWIYIAQTFLVVPCAITFWLIYPITIRRNLGALVSSLLVLIVSLFLVISPQVYIENPQYGRISRYTYTESETIAGKTITKIYSGMIFTHRLISSELLGNYLNNTQSISSDISKDSDGLIVISKMLEDTPQTNLEPDYEMELNISHNLIYDCSTIKGFIPKY